MKCVVCVHHALFLYILLCDMLAKHLLSTKIFKAETQSEPEVKYLGA